MPLSESAITGFSIPWVGAALAGALLVVALHLWNRGSGSRVLFPATALLRAHGAHAESRRRRTPRRWPLILVRALVVMLAMLAFDRPVFTSPTGTVSGERVVIVVDVSASMGMPSGGVTRFDRAIERARSLISDLNPARTPTALMLAGERTIDASGGFARNHPALRAALREAAVTIEADDLQRGVQRALDALGEGPGVIHIVSDMQHPPKPTSVPESVRVVLHSVKTDGGVRNLGVTALSWTPRFPLAGEALRVTASVRRAMASGNGASITLSFGGLAQRVPITFDADGTGRASAVFGVPPESEDEVVTVAGRLSPDAFTPDDERTGAVRVREQCDVLVIGGSDRVFDALAPAGVPTPYRVARVERETDIQDADAVVLAPVASLGVAVEDALVEAHARGVPMLWLIDGAAASDALGSFAGLIGDRAVIAEQRHETGGGVIVTPAGERLLPELSASGLLDDARTRRRGHEFVYPSRMEPIVVGAAGTPVVLHAGTLGVIDEQVLGAPSPALYVVLLHELLSALLQQAALPEQPEVYPAPETDPAQPLASGDDEQAMGIPDARAMAETPLGAYLAFCALALLAIEPLVAWLCSRDRGVE